MTTPKVKCDYCGYEGNFEIDVFRDTNNKFMCVNCGTDDLRKIVAEKILKDKNKRIKQKILDGLDGKRWLKCPYCKQGVFIRKEFAKVEISDDGESLTDEEIEILDEYEYRCASCDKDITMEELI